MKAIPFVSFLVLFSIGLGMSMADGTRRAAGGDPEGGTPPAPGEGAPSVEGARAASAREEHREFFELQQEIRKARMEARKEADVQAVQAKIDALSPEKDMDEIRKLRAEARRLAEKHLAEQPGMVEKLARLKTLGEEYRKTLPAEARRKGSRLPVKKEGAPSPEAKASSSHSHSEAK